MGGQLHFWVWMEVGLRSFYTLTLWLPGNHFFRDTSMRVTIDKKQCLYWSQFDLSRLYWYLRVVISVGSLIC